MSLAWRAKWEDVGKFLAGFRKWLGQDLDEDVNPKFWKILDGSKSNEGVVEIQRLIRDLKTDRENFLRKLEQTPLNPVLSRQAVRILAGAYSLPALMLDPLFTISKEKGHACLVESLAKFEQADDQSDYYGTDIVYRIPPNHLADCPDLAFGLLEVGPNGRSDTHDHPGSELLLLLDGPDIELCFESSGLRAPIRKGEFVHFRSEIPHCARIFPREEPAKPAIVFVIRFYQIYSGSTRQRGLALASDVPAMVRKCEDCRTKALASARVEDLNGVRDALRQCPRTLERDRSKPYMRLAKFVRSMTGRMTSSELKNLRRNPSEDVADLFGLSLMLGRIKDQKNWTLEKLAGQGSYKVNDLFRILQGDYHRPLTLEDLEKLAEQFKVEPMLLYSFMYPSEPDVVTGWLPRTDGRGDPGLTMAKVPEALTGEGVTYFVPRCNVALSDMSLLFVELGPHQATKANEHAGFELMIPIEGECIQVVFEAGGETHEVSRLKQQYALYRSENKHKLVNPGTENVRAFVARFYGWPG